MNNESVNNQEALPAEIEGKLLSRGREFLKDDYETIVYNAKKLMRDESSGLTMETHILMLFGIWKYLLASCGTLPAVEIADTGVDAAFTSQDSICIAAKQGPAYIKAMVKSEAKDFKRFIEEINRGEYIF